MMDFGMSTVTAPEKEASLTSNFAFEDATPDQMDNLRKVMNAESELAVADSMDIADEEDEEQEREENEKAAAEAAKDLFPDYEDDEEETPKEEVSTDGLGKVTDFGSVEATLHTNSLTELTSSTGALDNLIGASSALEMSDDNTDYLTKYSERVAAEADASDK